DIRRRVGNDHFVGVFSYGGMPPAEATRSMRLFAKEVMPALQALDPEPSAVAPALSRPRSSRGRAADHAAVGLSPVQPRGARPGLRARQERRRHSGAQGLL